jgi:CDP-diglyceride synthetase
MLKTRALVAVIALPILLVIVLIGGWLFAGFVFAALLVGGDEYMRLMRQGNFHPPEWLIAALIALPVGAHGSNTPTGANRVLRCC